MFAILKFNQISVTNTLLVLKVYLLMLLKTKAILRVMYPLILSHLSI